LQVAAFSLSSRVVAAWLQFLHFAGFQTGIREFTPVQMSMISGTASGRAFRRTPIAAVLEHLDRLILLNFPGEPGL
jgi:hypothetical protein